MGVIVSISGLLNDMLKQCVRCSQKKSTIAVHCYKHSYHNMFAHMCVLCFMSVCLDQKNTCCYKQCFINMPFRGCPWASLFIMGLLAGDYTCRLTLLLSFCAGTAVLWGGLRPPLFIMGLLVGDYICHLRLLLSLCASAVVSIGSLRPPLFLTRPPSRQLLR